jgi:rubrerythrin
MTTRTSAGHRLLQLLRIAHAAERGAAMVYAGHASSLRDAEQRLQVERIAREEWAHRHRLAHLIAQLGGQPARLREGLMVAIGHLGAALCHASGWYAPMYGAGLIEARNVEEYVTAADLALAAGLEDAADDLYDMARCEREHEDYFYRLVAGHRLSRLLPLWKRPALATTRERLRSERPAPSARMPDEPLALSAS